VNAKYKNEVKYVIFTSKDGGSEGKEIGDEGIYKITSKLKSETLKSSPIAFIFFQREER
jgi:hypothetical protein